MVLAGSAFDHPFQQQQRPNLANQNQFIAGPVQQQPLDPTSSSYGNAQLMNNLHSQMRPSTGLANQQQEPRASSKQLLQQLFEDMRQIEDTVDSIEIPARGRCRVYMAKYGYEPFKQSPNENPDAELAFNAGDYIMVFDEIDEDGYFIGELLDGRRGYVPSNWLDRLTGDDLFEFQATTLYSTKEGGTLEGVTGNHSDGLLAGNNDPSAMNYPPEFYDAILSDTKSHSNFQHLLAPEHYHRMNDYVDLDDVNEVDDECLSDYERAEAEQMRRAVPPPQRLALERQLNKSILIAWLHPQAAKGTIVSYQVYVDGVLKSTVPSGDRTKALLEGVDSSIPHRISVRAIDIQGRHSNDAGCTIVTGAGVPFAPSCVKASHITSDSALISWLPANSNFHHVVAVNSVEVQTVKPGVYKHLINGLSANTLYRVWVRAKPGKILSIDEKNPKKLEFLTTYVDFTTMPKSLPDPPVNVQVEAGPQRRTLLVTWLPLTLNDFGSSNGCAVTGYAVFAGHKKLADIDSPTGDHALLDLSDLESLHKKSVTVRTKSGENLSQDSMPCHIPDEYLKAAASKQHQELGLHHHTSQHHHHHPHSSIRHGSATALHQHRQLMEGAGGGRHSPMRSQVARPGTGGGSYYTGMGAQPRASRYAMSRQLSARSNLGRSLQNLESDLDSRHSSLPTIEVTRNIAGLDTATSVGSDQLMNNQHTESYSEEEFENSMRFRGARTTSGRSRQQMPGGSRYRTRQSHSVDSGSGLPVTSRQYTANNRPLTGHSRVTGNQQLDRDIIRYFVALFDYDPSTMSPNPNATSEELAFKEGSIIKVIGDKGPDGFYRGELDNHIGYVPCNVVSEITDPNLIFSLQQQEKSSHNFLSTLTRPLINTANANSLQTSNFHLLQQQQQQQQQRQQPSQQQQMVENNVRRMTALYDYDPQENSPNADTESEIPFKVGDVIYVYGKMDTDGFYMGEVERTKQRGLVPSNFLRESPLPVVPGLANKQQQPNILPQHQQQVFNPQQPLQPTVQMVPQTLDHSFQQQQQQRPNLANQNQFIAGPVQQQPLDPTSSSYGNAQLMNNLHSQMRPSTGLANQQQEPRAPIPTQRLDGSMIQGVQQQQQQQNINRPNSLSWVNPTNNSNNLSDWSNNQRAQQIQAMQNQNQMQLQGRLDSNQLSGFPSQQQQQINQQSVLAGQFNPGNNLLQQGQHQHQQQQQQQPGGGVLSNLLSSGKQIIGAATTPRAPNQPSQFPSMHNTSANPQQSMAMSSNFIGHPNTNNATLMTDPQNAAASYSNNQQLLQRNNQMMNQQATSGATGFNQPIHNNPYALTSNPQQMNQASQLYNNVSSSIQLGQQQHLNRGTIGEEQGGNILSTVKNMFKL